MAGWPRQALECGSKEAYIDVIGDFDSDLQNGGLTIAGGGREDEVVPDSQI